MLINIPYSARIALLIAFAAIVIFWDRMKKGKRTERQWEYGFMFLAGIVGAIYGALHDIITCSVSPDYFELGKRLTAGRDLILSAATLGAQAGFSAGAIAAAIWHYALRRVPAAPRCRIMLRTLWIPFASASLLALLFPFLLGKLDPLGFRPQLFASISAEEIAPFLKVWWTHVGSYTGLVAGVIAATVISRRKLKKAHDQQNGEADTETRLFTWRKAVKWAGIAAALLLIAYFAHRRWVLGPGHFAYPDLGRSPDRSLPLHQKPRIGVDLLSTTPNDFPGFLGPERRSTVQHVTLNPDWQANPPREVWRRPIGAGWSAFSVVNGFAVTMEQRSHLEQTTCYALDTGKHHWTVSWKERFTTMGTGPRSTPTIANGLVYALGAWGHLVCIEGKSGKVLWERELLADLGMHWTDENRLVGFGRSNSPLVTDSLVIVPGGGLPGSSASLLAYDALTGEQRWRGGSENISYSSPVAAELLGERQVLIVNENTVSGHSLDTGAELWSYPWPSNTGTDANVSQPMAISDKRILITKGYGRGAAVIELFRRSSDGSIGVEKVWGNRSVLRTKFTNVVIRDACAYGLSDGVLECVDLADGSRKWKKGRYGQGQILGVNDLLLVLGDQGLLSMVKLDPETPNQVCGQLQVLTGTTWNNIALYGKLLLVRNATEAACYELR